MDHGIRDAIEGGRRWLWRRCLCATRFLPVSQTRNILALLALSVDRTQNVSRQLLVDVSVVAKSDAGTGIQRVVIELLLELLANPPQGFVVRLVRENRLLGYQYAENYRATLLKIGPGAGPTGGVQVQAGDIFLGMDLAAHALPRRYCQLARWKASGIRFFFIVYDLLPALHPEWFSNRMVNAYQRWIKTVAMLADGTMCISRAVSEELKQWLMRSYGNVVSESVSVKWFHLGGEIARAKSSVDDAKVSGLPQIKRAAPTILMVGTIEPRKGYSQALAAFEKLWREGHDINLVIIGKAGWKVDDLVERLRNHTEAGNRLIWIPDATDQLLHAFYQAVNGLLMASEGEGFGLPIVEAARHGKPMLLRDIPVFREIADGHAQFFSGATDDALAAAVSSWLQQIQDGTATPSTGMTLLTWRDSARKLIGSLSLA